jgi:hypothetical protein
MLGKPHTLFIWLCFLLHLFAGTGMVQGAVICVAPGGHFAVELPHTGAGCVATQREYPPTSLESRFETPASQTCQDTPFFGAGSHLIISSSVELDVPISQRVSIPFVAPLLPNWVRSLRLPVTFDTLRSVYDSLRSIVLLV